MIGVTITTVAGTGICGYNGDGGPATIAALSYPIGLALDGAGALYIADSQSCRVRKVSGGTIATVAGNGFCSYDGEGGVPTSANLDSPFGVALSAKGSLYIANFASRRVQEVTFAAVVLGGADLNRDGRHRRHLCPGPRAAIARSMRSSASLWR